MPHVTHLGCGGPTSNVLRGASSSFVAATRLQRPPNSSPVPFLSNSRLDPAAPSTSHRPRLHLHSPTALHPLDLWPSNTLARQSLPQQHLHNGPSLLCLSSGRKQRQCSASRIWWRLVSATIYYLLHAHTALAWDLIRILPSRYKIYTIRHTPFINSIAATMTSPPVDPLNTDPSRARRTNGATQTFRRPSHATTPSGSTTHSSSRDASAPQNSSHPGVYVPPHAQPGRNGSSGDGRYSRDQLAHLFRTQQDSGDLNDALSTLYMGTWEPHATNGASGASWGRKEDHGREAQSGVDQCWDRDGSILPLSLADMTDDEKEVCPPYCAFAS